MHSLLANILLFLFLSPAGVLSAASRPLLSVVVDPADTDMIHNESSDLERQPGQHPHPPPPVPAVVTIEDIEEETLEEETIVDSDQTTSSLPYPEEKHEERKIGGDDDECPCMKTTGQSRLQKICEDCYNLYREVELYALCRYEYENTYPNQKLSRENESTCSRFHT